jgi:hypothetical protein
MNVMIAVRYTEHDGRTDGRTDDRKTVYTGQLLFKEL